MNALYHLVAFRRRGMSWRDSLVTAWRLAGEEKRWRAMWRERYWK
jgi:hypothetical protein